MSDSATPWTTCSPPDSSVHGILQAIILVAISFSSLNIFSSKLVLSHSELTALSKLIEQVQVAENLKSDF